MLKKLAWLFAITGGSRLALCAPSQAQKDKKVEKTKEEIQIERMQKLTTAYQLAEVGRKKNAPEYLITAAGMLRQLAAYKDLQVFKKPDIQLEITGGDKAAAKDIAPPSLLEQSDELFKEASDMGATLGANVDKLIKIAKERETSHKEERAVVGGPKQIMKLISAGQTHTYTYSIFTNAYSQWFFRSNAPLLVTVRRTDDQQPYFWGRTTYASRVWQPHWHPNPKVKQAPLLFVIQNYFKQPAQYQMMIHLSGSAGGRGDDVPPPHSCSSCRR